MINIYVFSPGWPRNRQGKKVIVQMCNKTLQLWSAVSFHPDWLKNLSFIRQRFISPQEPWVWYQARVICFAIWIFICTPRVPGELRARCRAALLQSRAGAGKHNARVFPSHLDGKLNRAALSTPATGLAHAQRPLSTPRVRYCSMHIQRCMDIHTAPKWD